MCFSARSVRPNHRSRIHNEYNHGSIIHTSVHQCDHPPISPSIFSTSVGLKITVATFVKPDFPPRGPMNNSARVTPLVFVCYSLNSANN